VIQKRLGTTNPHAYNVQRRPCYGSGGLLLATYHGCPGSYPDWSLWDLWWTKWHWDRFFSKFFGFPLSISFCHCSIFTYVIWGMDKGSVRGLVPLRHSLRYCNSNNNIVQRKYSLHTKLNEAIYCSGSFFFIKIPLHKEY
jgi:hypothetical protein